jgi:hypothetical protein
MSPVPATMRLRFAAVALGSAALLFTAVASAPARITNSCGPCPSVATIKDGSRTVLLQAVAISRPPRRSQDWPFWATDRLTWRLTFHGLDTGVSRATLRLGTIRSPGRYLFTLCGPCSQGAHGKVASGKGLARAATYWRKCPNCPLAAEWPIGATLNILLADPRGTRLAGELRFCEPNEYLHRNSCSPPGY